MENFVNQTLGRYHLLEQLGEGGMATVYKGYDTRLERDVAVKIIRRAAFPPEQLDHILKRFEREAKALAKLSHPNIVSVIDYGDFNGSPYFVMEFLPGGTLKQCLGQPIPWQDATRLLLPIANALQYAHELGVIHRDIKPANILITHSGEPMLSDFGIAKILETDETSTLTGTGMGIGTPEYMALEQWGGKATAKSDIYSLGVVLYEMITGRKPYIADTPPAILLKQANEALPRPKLFAPELPEKVEKVLLKAMAREPENRYPDMAAFADGLENLLAGKQKGRSPVLAALVFSRSINTKGNAQESLTRDEASGIYRREIPHGKQIPDNLGIKSSGSIAVSNNNRKVWQPRNVARIGWIGLVLVGIIGIGVVFSGRVFPLFTTKVTVADTDTKLILPVMRGTPYPELLSPITIENLSELVEVAQWRTYNISKFAWSPDSKTIAVASSTGVYLYDVATLDVIVHIKTAELVTSIAFSRDGALLAGGLSNHSIRIWQVSDGSQRRELTGHLDEVTSVAFAPDGTLLASGSKDETVRLWQISNGSLVSIVDNNSGWVTSVAFSPDGSVLASGSFESRIRLWRVMDRKLLSTLNGHTRWVNCIAFSPDGSLLASGSGDTTIRLWTRVELVHTYKAFGGFIKSISFSPDGKLLVSGSQNKFIHIWQVSTRESVKIFERQSAEVVGAYFSPNGVMLASGTSDGIIRLWGIVHE